MVLRFFTSIFLVTSVSVWAECKEFKTLPDEKLLNPPGFSIRSLDNFLVDTATNPGAAPKFKDGYEMKRKPNGRIEVTMAYLSGMGRVFNDKTENPFYHSVKFEIDESGKIYNVGALDGERGLYKFAGSRADGDTEVSGKNAAGRSTGSRLNGYQKFSEAEYKRLEDYFSSPSNSAYDALLGKGSDFSTQLAASKAFGESPKFEAGVTFLSFGRILTNIRKELGCLENTEEKYVPNGDVDPKSNQKSGDHLAPARTSQDRRSR